MAGDNVVINGTPFAADELDTVNGVTQANPKPLAERIKLGFGGDGAYTDVSSGAPLPVADAALLAVLGALADASSANTLVGLLKAIKAAVGGVPGTPLDFRKTITTATVREPLVGSPTVVKEAVITALLTNTDVVTVGAATVVGASGSRRGAPLYPGDQVTVGAVDLATVYADVAVNGEGVTVFALT